MSERIVLGLVKYFQCVRILFKESKSIISVPPDIAGNNVGHGNGKSDLPHIRTIPQYTTDCIIQYFTSVYNIWSVKDCLKPFSYAGQVWGHNRKSYNYNYLTLCLRFPIGYMCGGYVRCLCVVCRESEFIKLRFICHTAVFSFTLVCFIHYVRFKRIT